MTASPESLVDIITSTVGRDWSYDPGKRDGSVSFYVDSKHFVLEIHEVVDPGKRAHIDLFEPEPELSEQELARIERAQELAYDAGTPEWGEAQVAEFSGAHAHEKELGGEG